MESKPRTKNPKIEGRFRHLLLPPLKRALHNLHVLHPPARRLPLRQRILPTLDQALRGTRRRAAGARSRARARLSLREGACAVAGAGGGAGVGVVLEAAAGDLQARGEGLIPGRAGLLAADSLLLGLLGGRSGLRGLRRAGHAAAAAALQLGAGYGAGELVGEHGRRGGVGWIVSWLLLEVGPRLLRAPAGAGVAGFLSVAQREKLAGRLRQGLLTAVVVEVWAVEVRVEGVAFLLVVFVAESFPALVVLFSLFVAAVAHDGLVAHVDGPED